MDDKILDGSLAFRFSCPSSTFRIYSAFEGPNGTKMWIPGPEMESVYGTDPSKGFEIKEKPIK